MGMTKRTGQMRVPSVALPSIVGKRVRGTEPIYPYGKKPAKYTTSWVNTHVGKRVSGFVGKWVQGYVGKNPSCVFSLPSFNSI